MRLNYVGEWTKLWARNWYANFTRKVVLFVEKTFGLKEAKALLFKFLSCNIIDVSMIVLRDKLLIDPTSLSL